MATTFEIHPTVGVARVGTSTAVDGFFFAPEPGAAIPASFRDGSGALKRQAARFRIFKCERDAQGKITSSTEITKADGTIQWTVAVANRKGCSERLSRPGRRNDAASGDDPNFSILPKARTITGPSQKAVFDDGKFRTTIVPLGEIRTDADARLLFIPSDGGAGADPAGTALQHFADNDRWFDAMCDGPVQAVVTINNVRHTTKPAWVVVAPPDYAPEIHNIVSWYDVAYQAAVDAKLLPAPPTQPSFKHDILPILLRLSRLQWTSSLFVRDFGPTARLKFGDIDPLSLGDPGQNVVERNEFFAALRVPKSAPTIAVRHLPRVNDDVKSGDVLALTPIQYGYMKAWKEGTFVRDASSTTAPAEALPDALDRVSLQSAVGGAFFPGIEASGLIATAIYDEPFRIKSSITAGTLTQRNAVPWQADFLACRADPLAWWPAQRPDNVFLNTASALARTGAQRWDAKINGVDGTGGLIDNFSRMGFVRETTASGQTVFIERDRTLPR